MEKKFEIFDERKIQWNEEIVSSQLEMWDEKFHLDAFVITTFWNFIQKKQECFRFRDF